jgi:chromate transporter
VVGLILATAITMLCKTVLGFSGLGQRLVVDMSGILLLAILITVAGIAKRLTGKKPSPILMILISAGLGMLLYAP